MPDHAEFLRAILAHPHDDGPRLVYADYLDERGDPGDAARAEFVRVQCELASLPAYERVRPELDWSGPGYSDKCRRAVALRRRERELLDKTAHWAGWTRRALGGLAHDVGVSTDGDEQVVRLYGPHKEESGEFRCSFRRGFVEEVACPLAVLTGGPCAVCQHLAGRWADCNACGGTGHIPGIAPALFAAAPILRVRVTDREPFPLGNSCSWYRVSGLINRIDAPHVLPDPVWDLLAGWDNEGHPYVGRHYQFPAAACAALSDAFVAHGRSLAGLPPLAPSPHSNPTPR